MVPSGKFRCWKKGLGGTENPFHFLPIFQRPGEGKGTLANPIPISQQRAPPKCDLGGFYFGNKGGFNGREKFWVAKGEKRGTYFHYLGGRNFYLGLRKEGCCQGISKTFFPGIWF